MVFRVLAVGLIAASVFALAWFIWALVSLNWSYMACALVVVIGGFVPGWLLFKATYVRRVGTGMLTIYTKGEPPSDLSVTLCPKCGMVCANECDLDCPRCDRLIPIDLNKAALVDGVRFHRACAIEWLCRTKGVKHILGMPWDPSKYRVTLCDIIGDVSEFTGDGYIHLGDYDPEAYTDVCEECVDEYARLRELADSDVPVC